MPANHIVRQGECLASIAKHYGFADYTTIYDHPQNAELKRQRRNPNVLHPGDRLFIPDKEGKAVGCQTGRRHRFEVRRHTVRLRLFIEDKENQPYANRRYTLQIAGQTREGTTDGRGFLEQIIPSDAEEGTLTIHLAEGRSLTWPLNIGHLDPVEELTGVQARLNNLGFSCGAVDGRAGPRTEAAVRAFQRKYGLRVDGIPGPQTQAKLEEVHDRS